MADTIQPDMPETLRVLADGLVLRRSNSADAQTLADFNAHIHGDDPQEARFIAQWTRDLLLKPHPTFTPQDFFLVEDPASGQIVSALNLISQTWSYEGISFGVGRPELVGTDPAYRNRGLVRAQFEALHALSQARGELVQAITSIPYFYRQFGYEMTLELSGGWKSFAAQVPPLKEGQQEEYRIRPAQESDLPWLMAMEARADSAYLISAVRDEAHWRYELSGRSPENLDRSELRVIETISGQPVGSLRHPRTSWGNVMPLTGYQLAESVSYRSVTPAVIRYLWNTGLEYAQRRDRSLEGFEFSLGSAHPAYQAVRASLVKEETPYAYYLRVPDLPAFLRRIAPVLERRLRASPCAGHTGELKITFYRDGLRLVFDGGRITQIENWKLRGEEGAMAAFPALTFLHLVFGYRTWPELRYLLPDCWANEEAQALLAALFPKKPSHVWAIT